MQQLDNNNRIAVFSIWSMLRGYKQGFKHSQLIDLYIHARARTHTHAHTHTFSMDPKLAKMTVGCGICHTIKKTHTQYN
jgi:hypothetical protein